MTLQQQGAATVPLFLQWLTQERQRCERYNYFFSVLVLASPKLSASEILNRVSGSLRRSDEVGAVDGEGHYLCLTPTRELMQEDETESQHRGIVGIILPQTNRSGGLKAVERLSAVLPSSEQVGVGLAVYPDDSTDPEELLAIAARGAN